MRCSSFILLFLALSSKAETSGLTPNYENIEHKFRSFDIKSPLVLSCNTTSDKYPIKWLKNGTDVSKIDSLKGRYQIIPAENKFIIHKTDINDAGEYTCAIEELKLSADITAVAKVAVRVPSNTGVVEGEKLSIHCTVIGTNPEITWQVGNRTLTESFDRYKLLEENNIPNAKFVIESAVLEDRGDYTCIANNLASRHGKGEQASDVTFVRVKGKLAALWPFLGICAEVFVLCAIILIYEKRRNKTELDESDTDPNTEQEKLKPQRN